MPFTNDLANSFTAGQVVTESIMDSLSKNTDYLKGRDGAVTIEDAVTIQGSMTVSGTLSVTAPVTASGSVTVDGSDVWHPGNDGFGSGLDADTVDGWEATQLTGFDDDVDYTGNGASDRDFTMSGVGRIVCAVVVNETDTELFVMYRYDPTTFAGTGALRLTATGTLSTVSYPSNPSSNTLRVSNSSNTNGKTYRGFVIGRPG